MKTLNEMKIEKMKMVQNDKEATLVVIGKDYYHWAKQNEHVIYDSYIIMMYLRNSLLLSQNSTFMLMFPFNEEVSSLNRYFEAREGFVLARLETLSNSYSQLPRD